MAEQAARREAVVAMHTGSALAEWSQEVLALARRWWINLHREKLNLAFTIAQPAIWLVFFGTAVGRTINKQVIGTNDYIGFMLPGVIAFTIVGSGMAAAMPLLWDKEMGYLDKLMSMPIARSSVIVSRFVFQCGQTSVQVCILLAVAFAMGVRIESGLVGVLVILLAAALLTMAVTAAHLALAYWVPGHGTFFAIAGFVTMPLLFISNAFVPLAAMPAWMNVAARLNPLTYAIQAMRLMIVSGWETQVATALIVLTAFAAAWLAIGTQQFRQKTGERVS